MNECTYKNYDELPLMLNVVQVAAVLGISRAGAYELVHSEGFPALKIGSRIVVPKDRLREWIDANTAQKCGLGLAGKLSRLAGPAVHRTKMRLSAKSTRYFTVLVVVV